MQRTTNLQLYKPEYTDAIDVAVLSQNMDTIDTAIKTNVDNIATNTTEIGKREVYVITITGLSSLPYTSDTLNNIESDMVCIKAFLSQPTAQLGDWTVTTGNKTFTISGSFSGTTPTDVTLYFMKSIQGE